MEEGRRKGDRQLVQVGQDYNNEGKKLKRNRKTKSHHEVFAAGVTVLYLPL